MALVPFDDRDGFIWFDGQLRPWREARIHVLTHGLHYASAVFEGERAYNGQVFLSRAHAERLVSSGRLLGFDIPWTVDQIIAAKDETLKANNLVNAYVRPIAWRGSEMMAVSAQHSKIHMAIAVWEWPSYWDPEAKLKGLRVDISKWKRPSPETAPTASKAAGLYMIGTLSKHDAEAKGYDDALMLDWRGQVAEATGANICFVKNGVIHTPAPDCFLDGITRRAVEDLAAKRQIEVVRRAIQPGEMEGFEQAFLCGTAAEVTPLREIGPYQFEVGELTKTLMFDYHNVVNG